MVSYIATLFYSFPYYTYFTTLLLLRWFSEKLYNLLSTDCTVKKVMQAEEKWKGNGSLCEHWCGSMNKEDSPSLIFMVTAVVAAAVKKMGQHVHHCQKRHDVYSTMALFFKMNDCDG